MGAVTDGGYVRSWLFAPASRPDLLTKALATGADQVVWDLEDAVAPQASAKARADAAAALAALSADTRRPWIRIHHPAGADGRADLEALETVTGGLGRLVVAKADAAAVATLAQRSATGHWLLIVEGARGLGDLLAGRLVPPASVEARVAFGALDYALDLGLEVGEEEWELLFPRSQIAWASRAWGFGAPIDGPCVRLADEKGVLEAARRARALGFAGKIALHPRQLAAIHAAFAPTADQRDWARQVVEAADRAGGGVTVVDGAMIDRPVVERARRLLDLANHEGTFDRERGG
jgi:citrate lyase subunit beta/citryl-CoA lyase